jgi:large subunit ribosomal protein L6
MSRIGKKPVTLPAKVEVAIDGQKISVKGPKGQLSMQVHPAISVTREGGVVTFTRQDDERASRALHGLTRALFNNMVTGVTTGFRRSMVIEGVGYRAEVKNKVLTLYLGYSHPIEIQPPENISFSVEERGVLHVDGIDRQQVGQVAANIRSLRPPEPYKGKGIRYSDEVIRRKAGKAGKGK